MSNYPKEVRACDVVNGYFAPGQFKVKGGRAVYDEVFMADGGNAFYLLRMNSDLSFVKRWIEWDTPLIQLFDPTG